MQSHLTGDCDVVAVARWVGVAPQLSLCQGCSVSQSIKRARERGTERLGRRERRREVERVSSLCDRAMSNLAGLGDGLTGSVIDIWFHEEFRCGPREYYSLYSHTSHTVCVKVFLCTRANVCVCVSTLSLMPVHLLGSKPSSLHLNWLFELTCSNVDGYASSHWLIWPCYCLLGFVCSSTLFSCDSAQCSGRCFLI